MAAKSHFTCPHCKGQIKVIPQGKARIQRTFESVAPSLPPQGTLRSLFWFLRGNKPETRNGHSQAVGQQTVTIKLESWTEDRRHVLLDQFSDDITLDDLRLAADLIIRLGQSWSRPNFCRKGEFTQSQFHKLTDEFKRLNLLHVTPANRSILTPRAYALLRAALRI